MRSLRTSRLSAIVLYSTFTTLFALPGFSEEKNPADSTVVKVQRGEVVLESEHGSVDLKPGEAGRMKADAAPEKLGSTTLAAGAPNTPEIVAPEVPVRPPTPPQAAPAPPAPMDIKWDAAKKLLSADGAAIALKMNADGSGSGPSADGRFTAELKKSGELKIVDKKAGADERSSSLAPDGVWTHRFGGAALTVFTSGKTILKLADGKVVTSLPLAAPEPAHNWRIGVKLDANAQGRLVAGVVYPKSPAEKAGFKSGDEVLTVNGRADPTLDVVLEELKKAKLGGLIQFTVKRGPVTLKLAAVSGDWE